LPVQTREHPDRDRARKHGRSRADSIPGLQMYVDGRSRLSEPYELTAKPKTLTLTRMRSAIFCLLASAILSSLSQAQAPVFVITPEDSSIKFSVKASVDIGGSFDKWDAALTFASSDVTTGVLDVKIQAASVNTGSGMKDNKLKSKDFFDVKQDPLITFRSKKIVQTGPNTFDVQGDFTIRGVSKPETLTLTISGKGTGSGEIKGTMAFDRKDYGMTSGIPFIKIADRVEVNVDLKGKRVSGPPLVFKQ
jgi:polyisoprenoid-binding protein YceI